MDTQDFNKEARSIDNKAYTSRAKPNVWRELKEQIAIYQQKTARSWTSAIFQLLRDGLSYNELKEQYPLERILQDK